MADDSFENPIIDILTRPETEPDWLIPNLILQGSFVCFAGDAGAGKSFITYQIALAIACGLPALSGLVIAPECKRVVYFDQENSRQDREKYLRRAWFGLCRQNGRDPADPELLARLDEHFWPIGFRLGTDEWRDEAAHWVRLIQPQLIVFDTATSCFAIQDENDNAEANRAIQAVRELMALCTPEASAWVLKHSKVRADKGVPRDMRGAKGWKGFTDATLFLVRPPGRPMRSGLQRTRIEPDKVRAFGLRETIYITPVWTDRAQTGLELRGSFKADLAHRKHERDDEPEED